MKQKGFYFDLNRCTGCGACMIACSIEKAGKITKSFAGGAGGGFSKEPPAFTAGDGKIINRRQVYTFNEFHHPGIPLFNLSMACNHCVEPACMRACPAGAICKDRDTGAVTVDQGKCLGCKYCTWACPYDAPQYDPDSGVIEKCDFCIDRLKKNEAPACVCACPTNALRCEDFDDTAGPQKIAGFTLSPIQPAIRFKELRKHREVPDTDALPPTGPTAKLFESSRRIPLPKITLKSEWALLTFTSIAFILVALLTASLFVPLDLNPFIFLGFGAVGMACSTVHLGKKHRALYAVRNFKNSWLSREILLFSAFLGLSSISLVFLPGRPIWGWLAVIMGLLSLFAVDRIYQVAMKVTPSNFHSAHTLLDSLFLMGALVGNLFLFGIFGVIKLALYLYRKFHFLKQKRKARPSISFLRMGMGFVVPLVIFIFKPGFERETGIIGVYGLLIASVLIGELIDRAEYYDELDIITPRKQILMDMEKMTGGKEVTHDAGDSSGNV